MEIFGDGRQNSKMASGSESGTFAEDFDGRGRGRLGGRRYTIDGLNREGR